MNNRLPSSNTVQTFQYAPYKWLTVYDDVIYKDYCVQQKEETPMKKHFTYGGCGTKFDTKELATNAAKKQMEQYSRGGYGTCDIAIYEAVACVTFPIPSYEVVELAATPVATS